MTDKSQLIHSIFKNIVLKDKIFNHVKSIHKYLVKECRVRIASLDEDDVEEGTLIFDLRKSIPVYSWSQVYQSFTKLVQFGCLKELKQRLENEEIDHELNQLEKELRIEGATKKRKNNEREEEDKINKRKESYKGDKYDHRLEGLIELACQTGHLEIFKYLDQYSSKNLITDDLMEEAISNGHKDITLYLLKDVDRYGFTLDAIVHASNKGWIDVLKQLLSKWSNRKELLDNLAPMELATSLEALQILHEFGFECDSFGKAIELGSWDMIKFINQHYPESIVPASQTITLEIVKYLKENNEHFIQGLEDEFIDNLAINNKLDVLEYLIEYTDTRCSSEIIPSITSIPMIDHLVKHHNMEYTDFSVVEAAEKGNLDTILYLLQKGKEINYAMVSAVRCGHLNIVKHLLSLKPEILTTEVVDEAATLGHLELVKYFHLNNFRFSNLAMTGAIVNNHFDIVKYLHENRTEGYDPERVFNGNITLEILEFIHKNRTEELKEALLMECIIQGNLDAIKYITENMQHIQLDHEVYDDQIDLTSSNDLQVVQYLYKNRNDLTLNPDTWIRSNNDIIEYLINNNMVDKGESMTLNTLKKIIMYMGATDDREMKRFHLVNRIAKMKGWTIGTIKRYSFTLASLKYIELYTDFKIEVENVMDFATVNSLVTVQYLLDKYQKSKLVNFNIIQESLVGEFGVNFELMKLLIQQYPLSNHELDQLIEKALESLSSFVYNYLLSIKSSK